MLYLYIVVLFCILFSFATTDVRRWFYEINGNEVIDNDLDPKISFWGPLLVWAYLVLGCVVLQGSC